MWVALNVLSNWPRFRLFALVFLGSFLVYPARGSILNWITGAFTIYGRAVWNYIYENPNDLAGLTLLPLAFALWPLAEPGHRLAKIGAMASAGVCCFVIVITQSRGAMLGLIIMGMSALTGQRKKLRAILAVGFLAGMIVLLTPGDIFDRFLGLANATSSIEEIDEEQSATSRAKIWGIALDMFSDRPVTGWGVGAYRAQHATYTRGRVDIPVTARGARDAHSTYHKLLAESGIVGTALFAALVFVTLRRSSRVEKKLKTIAPDRVTQLRYLRSAFLGFMTAGLFASYLELAFLYLHLAAIWTASTLTLQGAAAAAPPRRTVRARVPARPVAPLVTPAGHR